MHWVSHIIAAELVQDRVDELKNLQSRPRKAKSRRVPKNEAAPAVRSRRFWPLRRQPSTEVCV